jgi:Spondin_N
VREKDFVHLPPLETDVIFPYMSVMAGMDPSPDWYTGWYSLWLIDEYSRTYYDHIKIQTYPWDAGTDGGTTYDSLTSDLDPPLNIERFVPRTAPEGGELKGPDGDVPVVAEWECFLVVGDVDMQMPDCDWFANPCCNETDTQNCGATLPNGALPSLTPELEQVRSNSPNSGAVQQLSFAATLVGLAVMHWILA